MIDFLFTRLYLTVSLNSPVSSVTSSEKVDKAQRYADFTLLSVPYPGKTPRAGSPHCISTSKKHMYMEEENQTFALFLSQDVNFLRTTKTETTQQRV